MFFEIQMEGHWHCSAQLCILTSCLICGIPKQRQPARVFRCHPPTHITSSLGFLWKRDLGRSHNQAPLACRLACRSSSTSYFLFQASSWENPEWVGTHSSNNSFPNSPACEVSFARPLGVRFQRLPSPFPSPWTPGLPHQRNAGSALQSNHHGDSSFLFQPVALDRPHAALSPAPARQDCKWQDL